jgi:hypothetical protein
MLNLDLLRTGLSNETVQFTIAFALALAFYRLYTTLWRPSFPAKAPALIPEGSPIIGASRFWTERWHFLKHWGKAKSAFSFYVGRYQVISLRGEANRVALFDNKELSFSDG